MSCHQRLLSSRSRARHASRCVSRRGDRKQFPARAPQAVANFVAAGKLPGVRLGDAPFSSMSICLIFFRFRILIATLCEVSTCSATFTCAPAPGSWLHRILPGLACSPSGERLASHQAQHVGQARRSRLGRSYTRGGHAASGGSAGAPPCRMSQCRASCRGGSWTGRTQASGCIRRRPAAAAAAAPPCPRSSARTHARPALTSRQPRCCAPRPYAAAWGPARASTSSDVRKQRPCSPGGSL